MAYKLSLCFSQLNTTFKLKFDLKKIKKIYNDQYNSNYHNVDCTVVISNTCHHSPSYHQPLHCTPCDPLL